eukprot:14340637-Ditylum_brightwellii.AAC.1
MSRHLRGRIRLPVSMGMCQGINSCPLTCQHLEDLGSRYLPGWMLTTQMIVSSGELIAMKQCCEYIQGSRYKLCMMGIPVIGLALIYGYNQSVLCNSSIPNSTLKKKSQSIAYHFVREGAARDEWRTAY